MIQRINTVYTNRGD